MTTENNDKAKKILFGNKNIGGDHLWDTDQAKAYDNITRKVNEAGVPVSFNEDEIWMQAKGVPVTNPDEADEQINKVLDYCNEIGLSPEQLIEDHKKFKNG